MCHEFAPLSALSCQFLHCNCWPTSLLSAIAFGFLNFFGSVFGDLTESMIKRDAGMKDWFANTQAWRHTRQGGCYIFTESQVHWHTPVKTILPPYGV
ncbi:hypothetical protein SLA2020_137540 [Shorea laevis]